MIRHTGAERSMFADTPLEDRGHVAHVSVRRRHPAVAADEQRVQVRQNDRVVVDVGHPRVGNDRPGGLVGIRRRRQPAAQVDELGDPLAGRPAHGPGNERLVLHDGRHQRHGIGKLVLCDRVWRRVRECLI